MQFQSVSIPLGLLFGIAAAQSTTATTSSMSSSTTSLPKLIEQLPSCALSCLPTVGKEIGCSVGDFSCFCSSSGSFVAHMGTCIFKATKNTCSADDVTYAKDITTQICNIMDSNADPAAVASASVLILSEVATATATTKSTATNAGMRMERGIGMVGAAALVALAL